MASGFKLNSKGVRDLLRSEDMQKILEEHADDIIQKLDTGYEKDTFIGENRANASVWTKTPEAVRDNSENNTLLKAVR